MSVLLSTLETSSEVQLGTAVNYTEYGRLPSGEVALIGRVKRVFAFRYSQPMKLTCAYRSHPDVAERHYPDLFKEFFPNGLPAQGFAY